MEPNDRSIRSPHSAWCQTAVRFAPCALLGAKRLFDWLPALCMDPNGCSIGFPRRNWSQTNVSAHEKPENRFAEHETPFRVGSKSRFRDVRAHKPFLAHENHKLRFAEHETFFRVGSKSRFRDVRAPNPHTPIAFPQHCCYNTRHARQCTKADPLSR